MIKASCRGSSADFHQRATAQQNSNNIKIEEKTYINQIFISDIQNELNLSENI